MTDQVAIVAEIRPGKRKDLERMLGAGPPFDLSREGFEHHEVFLGDTDVVFVFTCPGGLAEVERIAREPVVLSKLTELTDVLQSPRLLQQTFSWRETRRI
jgi:hypothetical protein